MWLLLVTFSVVVGLSNCQDQSSVHRLLNQQVIPAGRLYTNQLNQSDGAFNITLFCNHTELKFFEYTGRQALNCTISYSSSLDEVSLDLISDNPLSVKLETSHSTVVLPYSLVTVDVNISIVFVVEEIGESHVILINAKDGNTTVGVRLLVLRESGLLDLVFRIGLILLLCLATFLMGCEVELDVVKEHLSRPIGPVIGFACQFVLMPCIALALAFLTAVKPAFGFGLFLAGCCPGGGASNVWTKLLGGDLNLSLCMTLFSSMAAFGMLPLLLFSFSRFFFPLDTTGLPYGPIIINLIYLVVPLSLGLLVRRYRPSLATQLKRAVRPTSCIFLVYVIGFGSFVNLSIYRLIWRYPLLLILGAALPLIGFILGWIVALIARRPWSVVTAIAVETGVQNVGIAILILLYAVPQPTGDLGAVMPIIVAITTPLPLLSALLYQQAWSCWRRHHETNKLPTYEVEVTDIEE